jgi:hypothetical protein
MRDVFSHIRATPSREYLLRASYLEIYNEAIHDLLAPPSMASASEVSLTESGVVGLREEVVTSLKGIREVLARGEANRRTASTDWNERSSRSHSVFRLVRLVAVRSLVILINVSILRLLSPEKSPLTTKSKPNSSPSGRLHLAAPCFKQGEAAASSPRFWCAVFT